MVPERASDLGSWSPGVLTRGALGFEDGPHLTPAQMAAPLGHLHRWTLAEACAGQLGASVGPQRDGQGSSDQREGPSLPLLP